MDEDGAATERSERDLVEIYIQYWTVPYLAIYDADRDGLRLHRALWARVNPFAAILGPASFLARKLYWEALFFSAVIVVALVMQIDPLGVFAFCLFPVGGLFFNTYYVVRARQKIAAIEASGEPERARDISIREAGGYLLFSIRK